jgi:hypothetical protein
MWSLTYVDCTLVTVTPQAVDEVKKAVKKEEKEEIIKGLVETRKSTRSKRHKLAIWIKRDLGFNLNAKWACI